MKKIALFIASLYFATPACAQEKPANDKPFGLWLEEFKITAREKGINDTTLNDAFSNTAPLDRVVTLDQKQPESTITLDQYLHNTITAKRIETGRAMIEQYAPLLTEIGNKYHVQPRFIVALWGIETDFGRHTGGFQTVDALATLAYDGRRSEFFKAELINALTILQSEHMHAADMKGSWAGALGQCQFMPSTYLKYAVDYDGDGKRDIWDDEADAFGSIANYLQSLGWNDSEGWGRPVTLPESFDESLNNIAEEKPLSEWQALGVRSEDRSDLPAKEQMASLVTVGKDENAVPYLIYGNYKALLKWNRSRFFATAVGNLADAIGQ